MKARSPRPSEGEVRAECLLEVGALPYVFIWPNNTGALKVAGEEGDKDRFIRFGLPGSADIIGMVTMDLSHLTPFVPLVRLARFFALETKASHPPMHNCKVCIRQRGWGMKVAATGGFYAVARDRQRARAAIEAARRGEPGPWMT